jgi:hypothetical protein
VRPLTTDPVPQVHFHLSSAEWLAVAVNATLPDATGTVPAPELRLYRWDTGNCSDPATCPVALGLYDALPIAACESVVHFRAGGRDFVMYGGEQLLAAVTFTSLAELSGTRLARRALYARWSAPVLSERPQNRFDRKRLPPLAARVCVSETRSPSTGRSEAAAAERVVSQSSF